MKLSTLAAAFGAALAVMAAGSAGAQTLYGARGGNTAGNLYTINPTTGVATVVGPIGYAVTGMAYNSATSTMYGSTSTLSPGCPRCLITINLTTGAGTVIGPMGLGSNAVADIAWSGTTLYGWSEATDDLVTINTTTGAATVVGDAGIGTAGDGMDFIGGVLYAALDGDANALYTVNTTTGAVTAGPVMNGSGRTVSGGTAGPGGLLFASETGGVLFTINPTTGVVTNIGPTGIPNFDAVAFAGPVVSVPTLSEWAMILFAGLLAMAGALWVQRRRFGLA